MADRPSATKHTQDPVLERIEQTNVHWPTLRERTLHYLSAEHRAPRPHTEQSAQSGHDRATALSYPWGGDCPLGEELGPTTSLEKIDRIRLSQIQSPLSAIENLRSIDDLKLQPSIAEFEHRVCVSRSHFAGPQDSIITPKSQSHDSDILAKAVDRDMKNIPWESSSEQSQLQDEVLDLWTQAANRAEEKLIDDEEDPFLYVGWTEMSSSRRKRLTRRMKLSNARGRQ